MKIYLCITNIREIAVHCQRVLAYLKRCVASSREYALQFVTENWIDKFLGGGKIANSTLS